VPGNDLRQVQVPLQGREHLDREISRLLQLPQDEFIIRLGDLKRIVRLVRLKRLSDVTKPSPKPVDRRCKLTAVLVKDIRNAHDRGESIGSLARSYELSRSTVWKIVHGLYWKTVS